MDWLALATTGIKLVNQGELIINQVRGAIKDGQTALTTGEREELNTLLDRELAESRTAHANLKAALAGD